jgi:hypothetical protein
MKRSRLNPLLGGSATVAFAVAAVPFPGCEALLRDPGEFFASNTCNLFNCETLFFLEADHDEVPPESDADHDESESAVDSQ